MADDINIDNFKFVKDVEEKEKLIWNAAIEAAADYTDKEHSVRIGIEIRKLKK